ncbi:MAG: hypothetical protein JNM89_03670 [Hyphomicrobiaceae bacterium]|nr:hypothetical protein [Hyphomicrobiaceae bacterium]
MNATSGPGRGVLRLLKAMARADARVELAEDAQGGVEAVRVVRRGGGETPDVLHRASAEAWRAAVAAALIVREREGAGWGLSAEARRLLVVRTGPTAGGPEPALTGARGADVAETSPAGRPVENFAESPLGWLRRRRDRNGQPMVSDTQFDAGERLRADFELGQLTPRVTANWTALGSGQSRSPQAGRAAGDLRDSVVAARDRVGRALAAVGPELASVLLEVCCHLKGLEQLEREAGWPQRSGKVALHMALDALARHYGFGGRLASSAAAVIQHWATADYRPTIDG